MKLSAELLSAAKVAVADCMGLQPGERVAVITDAPCRRIGEALFAVTQELGHEVVLIEIIPRRGNGEEPPAEIAELMLRYDVLLCPTSKSLTHTNARRAACAAGARIATLPGVSEEIMVRCMNADYQAIAKRTNALVAQLEQSETVRVTAPAGTDITMPITGRKAFASHGLFHAKGAGGNLPTGEAFLAPLEGGSQGVVVVDGSMAGIGKLAAPLRIEVRDGQATEVSGAEADKLLALWQPHGPPARSVAEFGIGTNDKAILSGAILEDEKVMGTIHIAFGDNVSMGGSVNVPSHLDGLVTRPTVLFDGREVMRDGLFLLV